MAFASLIPVVGTALIWGRPPSICFCQVIGAMAFFMVLWCSIIVGMIDNFVRPLFMQGSGSNMSMLLIFLSILAD